MSLSESAKTQAETRGDILEKVVKKECRLDGQRPFDLASSGGQAERRLGKITSFAVEDVTEGKCGVEVQAWLFAQVVMFVVSDDHIVPECLEVTLSVSVEEEQRFP